MFEHPKVVDPNIPDGSKLFKTEIRNTIVKNGPKNPISEITLPVGFPSDIEQGTINARTNAWPHYKTDAIIQDFKLVNEVIVESGWSSKGILEEFIKAKFKPVKDSKGQPTTFVISNSGAIENLKSRTEASHVVSSLFNMGSTQNMSSELKKMGFDFDYPKSLSLIEYLISIVNGENFVVLDSFAGSGTTAQAVLNLNKKDNKNRRFIIIEMMDYVETISSERVKQVIKGYSGVEGSGGGFDFYVLGQPLFIGENSEFLNEAVTIEKIKDYIWYSETRTGFLGVGKVKDNKYFLGKKEDTAYYFIYEKDALTTLDYDTLSSINTKAGQYVIYADNCLLPKEFMMQKNIIFKKIPRDITRF